MKRVLQVVVAALAVAALVGPQMATAAAPTPAHVASGSTGGLIKVMKPHVPHHRHHYHWRPYVTYSYDQCGRVERTCARTYGWETYRFYRCVRRHEC